MPRNKTTVACDINDTVNLQYRSEGYEIRKVRAVISHIGCEVAENQTCLVFGEYIFFLLLRNMVKKHDYSIKAIRSPFLKNVPLTGKLTIFSNSPRLQILLSGSPECSLEEEDEQSGGKKMSYRIALSYRVEFWDPAEEEKSILSEAQITREGTAPSDGGSVKVWRVDSSQNHTIEQLLGIDRDTLKQFNKSHGQE